ncbi:MAG TPA: type II and III secretion system protein family protein [Steroidobacteraceae bacterium]|nr:type II and III secretion system protein family protein [Steroidobacteraceae bacterium]
MKTTRLTVFGLHLILGVIACLIVARSAAAAIASPDQVVYAGPHTSIAVPIYKSRIVELPAVAKRVSIGNPDIADVLIFNSTELYVLGKDLGTTNVLLWDQAGALVSTISVTVIHDIDGLKEKLNAILPGEQITVMSAHRNIVLAGEVSSLEKMDAALEIADGYLEQAATAKNKIMFEQQQGSSQTEDKHAGKVINLMSVVGPQQVMLQVRVAEVQRDALKHLNLQLLGVHNSGKWAGGASNGGTTTFPPINWLPQNAPVPVLGSPGTSGVAGPLQQLVAPTVPSITASGLFGSYLSGAFAANAVLDAYKQEGLARILAEPTLTTQSGQEAQFLSGGSFPIPVPENNGTIGITYKDFGVKVDFVPVILESGRINLKLNVSVSQLASTNSLVVSPISSSTVFAVPALTERRAISTVELADGQTIGIAGLMNDSMNSAAKKFPGLGDLPILGELFRSQDFQDGRTELVILVTPRLAKPMAPEQVRLPTDSITSPSNVDFFLRGKMQGRGSSTNPPAASPPGSSPSAPPPNSP